MNSSRFQYFFHLVRLSFIILYYYLFACLLVTRSLPLLVSANAVHNIIFAVGIESPALAHILYAYKSQIVTECTETNITRVYL